MVPDGEEEEEYQMCVCVCVYASLYVCASDYVQAFTGPSKLVLTGFVRPHARTHAHISTRMYLQLDTRNKTAAGRFESTLAVTRKWH
jgi:hypothetical protein